jgi:hypothetical protein
MVTMARGCSDGDYDLAWGCSNGDADLGTGLRR